MTLENLNNVLDLLKEEKKVLDQNVRDIEKSKNDSKLNYFERQLGDLLLEDDVLIVNGTYGITVRRTRGDSWENIFDLRFTTEWERSGSDDPYAEKVKSIGLSFYSTNKCDAFELDRVITLGGVAQLLKDNEEAWKSKVKDIDAKVAEELTKANRLRWDKDSEISDVLTAMSKAKAEMYVEALETTGIQFEGKKDKWNRWDLPELAVRFGETVSNVMGIKIISKTKSGKSAHIQVMKKGWVYSEAESGYVTGDVTEEYRNVRMANIMDLKWAYENQSK